MEGFSHPIDLYVNLKHRLLGLVRSASLCLMHVMDIRGVI